MSKMTFIVANRIEELKKENNILVKENADLVSKLNHATDQWNIWCAAYHELSEEKK